VTVVWAGMATLAERAGSRAMAIDSLLPQVDRLIVTSGDDAGDAVKFAAAGDAPDVFLGVDDDLIYPDGYVERLLAGLDAYPGAIVSFHGYTLDRDGHIAGHYPCTGPVEEDAEVHVVGSGVCAFHADTIRPALPDFRSRNAADIWLALLAEHQHVPRIVLAHDRHWFGYVEWPKTVWAESAAETGSALDGSQGRREGIQELLETAAVTVYPVRHSYIAAPTGDHITAAFDDGDYYEQDLLDALRVYAEEKTVIDVGAHVGNHSAFFAGESLAKRVIAVEPNPDSFRLLRRTVKLSGREQVECINAAVHPEWETASVVANGNGNSGMARVTNGGPVPVLRLDDFTDESEVGLVKVDAEGMSADVLRSGLNLLAKHQPVIAVEEQDAAEAGQVAAVLEPLGYRRAEKSYGFTPVRIWRR